MKKLFYAALIMILSAFTLHKYYVSVTEIYIKDQKLEIIIRTFPDDIENVLKDTYQIPADINDVKTKSYLQDYILNHFIIRVDGQAIPLQFAGITTDEEFLVILLEAQLPEKPKTIAVKNTILQDMFDEQKNIVHFFYKDDKQSYILIKQDPKATYIIK